MLGFIWFQTLLSPKKNRYLQTSSCSSISFLYPVRVSRCHGHTHFHENSSQAPFLLLLSDDLYVPNLNANPEKKQFAAVVYNALSEITVNAI